MNGVVTEMDGSGVIIGLKGAFPAGTVVGTKTGSLIDAGEAKDVVYFERPANATTDAEMSLFVMEAGGEFADRRTVRFGRQSGSLIEIVSGLEPGDRVIVTDTTQWNSHDRIRIK
jgi:multidrug efflux pump subunit AcrA (membrane-fusion protein)